MKYKFKSLFLIALSVFMLVLVGCTSNDTNNDSSNNSTTNSDSKNPPTNEEYYTYLTDEYNKYLNSNLNDDYDVYVEDFTYDGTYDEFVAGYNTSYENLRSNLEAFKKDLETNVVKGNADVDKLNAEVITGIDKAIIAVDDYTGSFTEKTKDYASLSKDEVVKGFRDIGSSVHNARLDLKNMIDNAKDKLGIK